MAAGVLAVLCLVACRDDADGDAAGRQPALLPGLVQPASTNADATPPAVPFDSATPRLIARAQASWPHDTAAYTQGLIVDRGRLLESTGLEGHSDLREVTLQTGRVVRHAALPRTVFGEGIAVVGDRLYQLTWRAGRGYVYDARTFALVDSVSYAGEGWGLASDGQRLYFSDGTSEIRIIDPNGFREQRRVRVTEAGKPVWMLNELEFVRGELWANIYETNLVARIDPATGQVAGWVDLGTLLTPAERADAAKRGGVANGIAYDSTRDVVLVTGKLWPRMFELDLRSVR
jgi:glutaminyl-peptide cyclotransferase